MAPRKKTIEEHILNYKEMIRTMKDKYGTDYEKKWKQDFTIHNRLKSNLSKQRIPLRSQGIQKHTTLHDAPKKELMNEHDYKEFQRTRFAYNSYMNKKNKENNTFKDADIDIKTLLQQKDNNKITPRNVTLPFKEKKKNTIIHQIIPKKKTINTNHTKTIIAST